MGLLFMNNNEKYYIDSKNFIDEKKLIYILSINGFFVIIAINFMIFWNFSYISFICSIIIFVTLSILINYFIITKLNLLNKNFLLIAKEFNDEIEEYQTIMK
jgi:hypothetical protein